MDAVAGETPPAFEGSLNGEYTTVDRATLVEGEMFDPKRPGRVRYVGERRCRVWIARRVNPSPWAFTPTLR